MSFDADWGLSLLHFFSKTLCWFETWEVMCINSHSGILKNIACSLCLIIKLPNPRRYTFSFLLSRLSLIVPIKLSTTTATSFFCKPVDKAISLMISAFVILSFLFIYLFPYSPNKVCKYTIFRCYMEIYYYFFLINAC